LAEYNAYNNMLAAIEDQAKQRVLAELLQDAEEKFQQISSPKRLSRQRRAA